MRTKILNFFPYYEELLSSRKKTTTIRVGPVDYREGEIVHLTVGWSESDYRVLHKAKILCVYEKAVQDLDTADLSGESPDCLFVAAVPLVLGAIYRKVLTRSEEVTVIKFEHHL